MTTRKILPMLLICGKNELFILEPSIAATVRSTHEQSTINTTFFFAIIHHPLSLLGIFSLPIVTEKIKKNRNKNKK